MFLQSLLVRENPVIDDFCPIEDESKKKITAHGEPIEIVKIIQPYPKCRANILKTLFKNIIHCRSSCGGKTDWNTERYWTFQQSRLISKRHLRSFLFIEKISVPQLLESRGRKSSRHQVEKTNSKFVDVFSTSLTIVRLAHV